MAYRGAIGASVLAAVLLMTVTASQAFDETKYPDLKGQWRRGPNANTAGVLGGRRPGHRRDLHLRIARNAARHQRVWTDRIRGDAGGDAHSGRKHLRLASHLHGRPRLAPGDHAVPHRLFD